jgi:AcrR family transcriptional regulator
MKLPSAPAGHVRPPGRGPKVRAAVLAATLTELTENGYTALTIDNVARRSGVHKTTIYRRWKDRDSLVADAVIDLAAARVPFPDTHDIDADLRELARSLVRFFNSPVGKAVLAATLSDAARLPEIAEAKRRFFQDRFRRAEPAVAGAIARGQLPADTDPAELVRTLVAPIYLRLLVTAEPITGTTADNAARVALAAARAGALSFSGTGNHQQLNYEDRASESAGAAVAANSPKRQA